MHSIWHEMFKIGSASGSPLQTPLGQLTAFPRQPSREGLLAFGNRTSRLRRLQLNRRAHSGRYPCS